MELVRHRTPQDPVTRLHFCTPIAHARSARGVFRYPESRCPPTAAFRVVHTQCRVQGSVLWCIRGGKLARNDVPPVRDLARQEIPCQLIS